MTNRTLLMTSALRIPVFIWADHPHPRQRSLMSRSLRATYLRLLSRALVQGFLVCGNATGEYLAALGIPRQKIHNFPYWVEVPEKWSLPARCLSREPRRRPLRVLAIGRHVAGKNFDVAIRAIKLANERARSDATELVVVGDGPERINLERLVASLALDRSVSFKGWLENDRVQSELEGCDALVIPSEFEGYGVAAREALAQGRPVLCSNGVVAALDQAIKSNAILLHPVGDVKQLASHLLLLANEAELLRKACEEARKLAEEWPPVRAISILQQALPRATTIAYTTEKSQIL
jgi:glycosyltransferase involved in cell wall biosynthesis